MSAVEHATRPFARLLPVLFTAMRGIGLALGQLRASWRWIVRRIKRFLPKSLFGRALLIILTPVLLTQAIATYYFYDQHWDKVTQRLSQSVSGQVVWLIEELGDATTEPQRDALFDRVARTTNIIASFEPEGALSPQVDAGTFDVSSARLIHSLAERLGDRPFSVNSAVARDWVLIAVQVGDGVLTMLVPRRLLFSSTSQVFLLWMMGSGAILFTAALIFMRNQIRPIRRLAHTADAFGKGRDRPGFKIEGAAEVRQAARAFLMMRERIQRQISQRTEMLAGVSHDLRTPLTRMKLQLALLGDDPDVADLRQDVVEMQRMIEGYLAFARGEGAEAPEPTDVALLINDVVTEARRAGIEIALKIDDLVDEDGQALVMPLRRQAMRRCFDNLLSNAGRYAREVRVAVRCTATHLDVVIDDNGPGIPEAEREAVFKPFYRRDPARDPNAAGTGLGLTIARDVARSHGGDIILGGSPLGGLRCSVTLPI